VGEVVWRISGHPEMLGEGSRDENFYFRTYGLLVVTISLVLIVSMVGAIQGPLSSLVQIIDSAVGAERVVVQALVVTAGLLIVGLPIMLVSLSAVAGVVGIMGIVLKSIVSLIRAHKYSSNHKSSLLRDKKCGCYHCMKIFAPKEIESWIDDKVDGTAICPHCGVDAILGESSGFPITARFLRKMHRHYFS